MSEDNENCSFLGDAPLTRSEPQGFRPDQMVRCDECLRANPPTRVNCLYCATSLPVTEASAALQRPALRRLEQWELGYNNILLSVLECNISEDRAAEIGDLLRLETEDVKRIIGAGRPLPLARAASLDEASLIERRLRDLGVETMIVPDREPEAEGLLPRRIRACELTETEVAAHEISGGGAIHLPWARLTLLVTGRLFIGRIEVKERKRRAKLEILDATETSTDEVVADLYSGAKGGGWRLTANSFDFSCLGDQKSLIAQDNFSTLLELVRARAVNAEYDDSYNLLRRVLEPVWPSEQQTVSVSCAGNGPESTALAR